MSKGKFKGLHKMFREKSKKGSQRISSYRKSREDRSPPGGGYETGRPNVDLVCKKDLINDSSSLPGIESVSDTSWQISEHFREYLYLLISCYRSILNLYVS